MADGHFKDSVSQELSSSQHCDRVRFEVVLTCAGMQTSIFVDFKVQPHRVVCLLVSLLIVRLEGILCELLGPCCGRHHHHCGPPAYLHM